MASVTFRLSEKGGKDNDRPEFRIWFRYGTPQRRISCRTGLYGFRDYWSEKKQKHNTKLVNPLFSAEVIEVNDKLSTLRTKIETAADNTPDNAISRDWLLAIVEDYLHPTKKEEVQQVDIKTLMQAVDVFIKNAPDKLVKSKGTFKHIAPRTMMQYKQLKDQLTAFLKYANEKDIPLSDVDEEFYKSFVKFLEKQGYKVNTIGYFIKNLKAVLNALPANQRNTCELLTSKKCVKLTEDVSNIYLDEAQLQLLAEIDLADKPCLDKVRDQFLLLAWTGCRYSDLGKLNKENIVMMNGREYFKITQQKTGAKPTIPVFPTAAAILKKYDYNVPREISNQKFNEYIKQVCRLAKIDDWQRVTTHTGRRSFATNFFRRGFPTLMIMRATGHQTESAFLRYIKVTEDENAERMIRLFEEQEKRYQQDNTIAN